MARQAMNDRRFIVPYSGLCDLCATDQEADVVTWLSVNDIAFFLDANDQLYTTESLRLASKLTFGSG